MVYLWNFLLTKLIQIKWTIGPISDVYSWVMMFIHKWMVPRGKLDTYGNCRRPVFLLGVSQHLYKITNLWKFELSWSSKLRENNGKKKNLVAQVLCFQMLAFETQLRYRIQIKYFSEKLLFLKNYVTNSEGAVSHNVLYYQQLSIARYQRGFMLTTILSKCLYRWGAPKRAYWLDCARDVRRLLRVYTKETEQKQSTVAPKKVYYSDWALLER